MEPLEKGITGFNSERFISKSRITDFLRNFHHPYVPSYKTIEGPHESSNYYRIPFTHKLNGSEFDLLINSSYWKMALITRQSTWMNLEFIIAPLDFIQQVDLSYEEVEFLSPEVLNRAVNSDDLTELTEHERAQIRYWRSRTIGEIIFNGYD